jgi:hypothetical protein
MAAKRADGARLPSFLREYSASFFGESDVLAILLARSRGRKKSAVVDGSTVVVRRCGGWGKWRRVETRRYVLGKEWTKSGRYKVFEFLPEEHGLTW